MLNDCDCGGEDYSCKTMEFMMSVLYPARFIVFSEGMGS